MRRAPHLDAAVRRCTRSTRVAGRRRRGATATWREVETHASESQPCAYHRGRDLRGQTSDYDRGFPLRCPEKQALRWWGSVGRYSKLKKRYYDDGFQHKILSFWARDFWLWLVCRRQVTHVGLARQLAPRGPECSCHCLGEACTEPSCATVHRAINLKSMVVILPPMDRATLQQFWRCIGVRSTSTSSMWCLGESHLLRDPPDGVPAGLQSSIHWWQYYPSTVLVLYKIKPCTRLDVTSDEISILYKTVLVLYKIMSVRAGPSLVQDQII